MGNSYTAPAFQSENLLNKIKAGVSETTGWDAFSDHGLSQLVNFVKIQIVYRELDGKNEKNLPGSSRFLLLEFYLVQQKHSEEL